METLLEGRCEMAYYTDLRLVFRAIGDRQREFNWLITDLEYSRLGVYDDNASPPFPFTSRGPNWRTGDRFRENREVVFAGFLRPWVRRSAFPQVVAVGTCQGLREFIFRANFRFP